MLGELPTKPCAMLQLVDHIAHHGYGPLGIINRNGRTRQHGNVQREDRISSFCQRMELESLRIRDEICADEVENGRADRWDVP